MIAKTMPSFGLYFGALNTTLSEMKEISENQPMVKLLLDVHQKSFGNLNIKKTEHDQYVSYWDEYPDNTEVSSSTYPPYIVVGNAFKAPLDIVYQQLATMKKDLKQTQDYNATLEKQLSFANGKLNFIREQISLKAQERKNGQDEAIRRYNGALDKPTQSEASRDSKFHALFFNILIGLRNAMDNY